MRKIREVLRLTFECHRSEREIAHSCRVSRNTVAGYLAKFREAALSWPEAASLTESQLIRALFPGKPLPSSIPRPAVDCQYIYNELRTYRKINLTLAQLWHEYKETYPDGYQYSQYCELYRRWRKKLDYCMRQEHRGGEKVFIDYCDGLATIDALNGEIIPTQLFVAVWGASNFTFAEAKIKTDTIDAQTLAALLRADLIPTVHVPSPIVRAQKNLLRQRFWLVELRTRVKNRTHHILDRNHVTLPSCSDLFGKAGRQLLDQIEIPAPDNLLLKAHLELLDYIEKQIDQAEKWTKEALEDHPGVAILRTIPGIGKILAALVALEIDDISRFSVADKLCAYAGLVPTTYASGGKVRHGNLLPTCNRWLRWAYVEAAWIAQRTSPYCHAYFERIKRRKGANCANTALARRLCEITWHCLREKRSYEERSPVRTASIQPAAFQSSWS